MVGPTNGTGKSCTFFPRIGKAWGRSRGGSFGDCSGWESVPGLTQIGDKLPDYKYRLLVNICVSQKGVARSSTIHCALRKF